MSSSLWVLANISLFLLVLVNGILFRPHLLPRPTPQEVLQRVLSISCLSYLPCKCFPSLSSFQPYQYLFSLDYPPYEEKEGICFCFSPHFLQIRLLLQLEYSTPWSLDTVLAHCISLLIVMWTFQPYFPSSCFLFYSLNSRVKKLLSGSELVYYLFLHILFMKLRESFILPILICERSCLHVWLCICVWSCLCVWLCLYVCDHVCVCVWLVCVSRAEITISCPSSGAIRLVFGDRMSHWFLTRCWLEWTDWLGWLATGVWRAWHHTWLSNVCSGHWT